MYITIQEVAKLANVSVATVSRVLNNTGAVAEKTKAKVLDAANQLGYEPNLLGKHLRRMETKIILVMLSSLANTFCSKVIRGIEKQANQNGYNIMICATNDNKETERTYLNYVKNKFADGIIILNSSLSQQEMSELSKKFPVVQCSEYIDTKTTPYVSIDNEAAAFDATSQLIESGRNRILYLGVDNDVTSSKLRMNGYKRALSLHTLPFDKDLIIYGNYGYRNAIYTVEKFLDKKIKFDAVFAISDRMAAGAITALKRHNLSIPSDIEVIGFDNIDLTYMFEPTISTVSQPQGELGSVAFNQLYKLLRHEKPENVILKHKLILRNSTKKEIV